MLPAGRKVVFQFFVPNQLVLLRNEPNKFGQLFATQLRHSFFYFGQAHSERLSLADDMISAL